jgi:hypothetical protein
MPSSISNAKRADPIQDTAAEWWSRLYVDASYGRASIQAALLLNGGSVALPAFMGNLAIAHQTKGLPGTLWFSKAPSRASESG